MNDVLTIAQLQAQLNKIMSQINKLMKQRQRDFDLHHKNAWVDKYLHDVTDDYTNKLQSAINSYSKLLSVSEELVDQLNELKTEGKAVKKKLTPSAIKAYRMSQLRKSGAPKVSVPTKGEAAHNAYEDFLLKYDKADWDRLREVESDKFLIYSAKMEAEEESTWTYDKLTEYIYPLTKKQVEQEKKQSGFNHNEFG